MATRELVSAEIVEVVKTWVDSHRANGGIQPGILATGLVVVGHLAHNCPLSPDDVVTDSQVRGSGGPSVMKILRGYGEERQFLKEGGRTSRRNRDRALNLATALNEVSDRSGFIALAEIQRRLVVEDVQKWFVERIRIEYFERQRIEADIDPSNPASVSIASLMLAAMGRPGNVAGAVAQHLVGAKLQLRFPDEAIGTDSYTTADQQTERQGDFTVGDTAFHVTMSPTQHLMEGRCRANLNHRFRPVVIVPRKRVPAAQSQAEMAGLEGRIEVLSIEGFVGLNIEEMATFKATEVRSGLRRLLETYNERVKEIETDPSLMIEIPSNL